MGPDATALVRSSWAAVAAGQAPDEIEIKPLG